MVYSLAMIEIKIWMICIDGVVLEVGCENFSTVQDRYEGHIVERETFYRKRAPVFRHPKYVIQKMLLCFKIMFLAVLFRIVSKKKYQYSTSVDL